MNDLLILGLPARAIVRQLLEAVLERQDLERVKFIRVTKQLWEIERGSRIYALPPSIPSRELHEAIIDRGMVLVDITPAGLAQHLRQT